MTALADITDPRFTPDQLATVAAFDAAPPAPESFRPLPGEVEMHRAMNATTEQVDRLRAALAPQAGDGWTADGWDRLDAPEADR